MFTEHIASNGAWTLQVSHFVYITYLRLGEKEGKDGGCFYTLKLPSYFNATTMKLKVFSQNLFRKFSIRNFALSASMNVTSSFSE